MQKGEKMVRRFLAIGECMIEMAPQADGHFAMGFAGDTFNTAWYVRQIADASIDVAYLSAVGDDAPSRRMVGFMREAGVTPRVAEIPGASVGLYLITLDGAERSFAYWRSASAARQLTRDLSALNDLGAGDVAYFSGITLAILDEAARLELLDALSAARGRGVATAFDPNYRPRLWRDAGEARHWIMRAAEVSEVVLPSFDDERLLFGDASVLESASRYSGLGVPLIVVKNGSDPVRVEASGTVTEVAAERPEHIVDTTAAGDSFNAGFLVGLMAGTSPADAARRGCRLAARVIGARGALVPIRS
jgi:2-dehydro-3-deoxygluconokinase